MKLILFWIVKVAVANLAHPSFLTLYNSLGTTQPLISKVKAVVNTRLVVVMNTEAVVTNAHYSIIKIEAIVKTQLVLLINTLAHIS